MSIEQAEARFSRDPFAKFLGMNLVDIAHERAVVTLPYQPERAKAAGTPQRRCQCIASQRCRQSRGLDGD